MVYNERYSIFRDFNKKSVRVYDDKEDRYIPRFFDSEEEAILYLESIGEKRG